MRYNVELSPQAGWDLLRLANFLADRNARAAGGMSAALRRALDSLAEFPKRAPLINDAEGLRELRVSFGKHGYAIHYIVEADVVFVAQIFHIREAR